MSGQPYSKQQQLARGERRYVRQVAAPKRWQAIIEAKRGPCRVCNTFRGGRAGLYDFHHLVARVHGGGDTEDNIVPLHRACHERVTRRNAFSCCALLVSLTDAEYAYLLEQGGEDYPERAYGIEYRR